MDKETQAEIMEAIKLYRAAALRAFTTTTAAEIAIPGSVIIDAAQAAVEKEAFYRRRVEELLANA